MVSPVHSWLGDDITTDQGTEKAEGSTTALTGCSDGEDEAYLYYMFVDFFQCSREAGADCHQ